MGEDHSGEASFIGMRHHWYFPATYSQLQASAQRQHRRSSTRTKARSGESVGMPKATPARIDHDATQRVRRRALPRPQVRQVMAGDGR